MSVRNYWIEANIDGRKTELTGGPVNREGGFDLTIYQRDRGSIKKAVIIRGFADQDGALRLYVAQNIPTVNVEAESEDQAETKSSFVIRTNR